MSATLDIQISAVVVDLWSLCGGLCTGVLSGTLDEIVGCLANVGDTN